ncbi:MAG: hypothetical protein QNL04_01540 [SAR324 cluster bacterium]|nr:hypothetical protein [SAR324 cluster bacterium]
MLIKGHAQKLAQNMTKLSTKYHKDSWMAQLEFELWREITEKAEFLNHTEVKSLKSLASSAGGWIVMDYKTKELEFMNTGRWQTHYKKNNPF